MDSYVWVFLGATVALYGGLALYCWLKRKTEHDPYREPWL